MSVPIVKSYVLNTESQVTPELLARLTNPDTVRLLHAGMGLCTEAGEFLDMLKKHIFYGKKLDFPNAVEELGDVEWYAGIAIDVLRTTFNEVLTINIDKLKARYPEKFTEHHAINRDLETERAILERLERK
jgi:NTP pyrophosphatase (non-canonical NTP hydrolase)